MALWWYGSGGADVEGVNRYGSSFLRNRYAVLVGFVMTGSRWQMTLARGAVVVVIEQMCVRLAGSDD